MITKVISGGQTGVDRAALDAALAAGLQVGGWCPKGRRAEDGPIPDRYPLVETATSRYAERTRRNVRDAAATLILTWAEPTGGTALTLATCRREAKRFFLVNLNDDETTSTAAITTLAGHLAHTVEGSLNVAGPRESEHSGVYTTARQFLDAVFARVLARAATQGL
jgi:hypothetical protein